MATYTATEAKNNFDNIIEEAQESPVLITRYGKPCAIVLSPEDYEAYLSLKGYVASDLKE